MQAALNVLKNKGLYENNEMGQARYIVRRVAASAWLLARRTQRRCRIATVGSNEKRYHNKAACTHPSSRPQSAVSIGSGTWRTDGTNKESRAGRYFSIDPNNEHKAQYGGFGKGFNRIGELPDFFREHSEHIPANNRYYRHNSRNDPDLPFVEIHYDGNTGKIDYIHVYEKQRDVLRGSRH